MTWVNFCLVRLQRVLCAGLSDNIILTIPHFPSSRCSHHHGVTTSKASSNLMLLVNHLPLVLPPIMVNNSVRFESSSRTDFLPAFGSTSAFGQQPAQQTAAPQVNPMFGNITTAPATNTTTGGFGTRLVVFLVPITHFFLQVLLVVTTQTRRRELLGH